MVHDGNKPVSNILVEFELRIMSQLDAVDTHKTVHT